MLNLQKNLFCIIIIIKIESAVQGGRALYQFGDWSLTQPTHGCGDMFSSWKEENEEIVEDKRKEHIRNKQALALLLKPPVSHLKTLGH